MAGSNAVSPILPLFAGSLGADLAAIGTLISAFFAARVLTDLVGAAFSDRLGADRTVLLGCVIMVFFSAGAALAPNYGILLLCRLGQGVGMSAALLGSLGFMFSSSSGEVGSDIAGFQGAQLLGLLVGPFVGGLVAEAAGLRFPFWLNALFAFVSVALLVPVVRKSGTSRRRLQQTSGRWTQFTQLVRLARFRVLLGIEMLLFVVRIGVQLTLLPLFASQVAGLSESEIGQVLALAAASHLLVVRLAGRVVEHFPDRYVAATGLAAMGIVVGMHRYADSFADLAVLSLVLGLVGAVAYIVPPVMAGRIGRAGTEGLVVGVYRTAGSSGSVLGPLLVGWIAGPIGLGATFTVFAGLLIAAALSLAFLSPRSRQVSLS